MPALLTMAIIAAPVTSALAAICKEDSWPARIRPARPRKAPRRASDTARPPQVWARAMAVPASLAEHYVNTTESFSEKTKLMDSRSRSVVQGIRARLLKSVHDHR